MIEEILKGLLSRVGIEEKDIDKAKEILNKIEFTVKDGKKVMIVHIGDGVELTIVQKED
jgi:hypothetical protein